MMSQLIDIDPQIQPGPEPEGYEFGYYTFDMFPTLEVTNVEATQKELPETKDKDAFDGKLWKLPISNDSLSRLQQEDVFHKNILNQIEKCNIVKGQLYLIKDKILKRYVVEGDITSETTVIP